MATAPASPSALNRFLGCEYATYLQIRERRGELKGERRPPNMAAIQELGNRFEDGLVDRMRAEGRDVVALEDERATREQRAARTIEAMREGREVLHQGCFSHDGWVGYPDFLLRVEQPSIFGAWSYEVADAKLGRTPYPKHIFQLLFYTEQLDRIQQRAPARMRLFLGDGSEPEFHARDFTAYAERIRALFGQRFQELQEPEPTPAAAYPYPVSDCEFCDWWKHCDTRRRADDHLSLVAGLRSDQGHKLEAHGLHTLPALAAFDSSAPVDRLQAESVEKLRAQASLQLRSRALERPLFELLEPGIETGLTRLPEPSPGDVHFDFEGDPYWGDEGLEYLFGSHYEDDPDSPVYWPLWALTRAEEKVALERWIDWITARLEQFPELHVFHYNAKEPTALKQLVARHATREHELDELLRRKVFVDLYGITRQAIRAGVESYGLKGIEPVFGFERSAELQGALGSMKRWQAFQEDGDQRHLDEIALYNADDCRSTDALYAWLRARRPETEAQFGIELGSLQPEAPKPLTPKAQAALDAIEALRKPLTGELPDDESRDTPDQRALRTTFDVLGYHRREAKPSWWALFDRRERSAAQLRLEDGDAIGELEVVDGPVQITKTSKQWTLRFPAQEHKLRPGGVDDPDAERSGTIRELDDDACTLIYRRGNDGGEVAPTRLAPNGPLNTDAHAGALLRFAERVAKRGLEPCGELDAGTDLLLGRAPRLVAGTPPLEGGAEVGGALAGDGELPAGEAKLERLKAQVRGLDASALMIQGPPGSGKTYTGARLAVELLRRDRPDGPLRIGVMATSHKAINNLLEEIDAAADEAGVAFRGWKKVGTNEEDPYESDRFVASGKEPRDDGPPDVIGATSWHWAAEAQASSVDVLFIDEAGQVSLADAIAVSQAARSVVLLGDPQQLAHVSQGTHPRESGASVLEHLLGGAQTVAPERGVLLETSWRMHPGICDFISGAMYDGRLTAKEGNELQRIEGPALAGSGLRLLACEHEDNRVTSIEEADLIAAEIKRLLAGGSTYTLRGEAARPLTLDDILVVAPYNAQVRCLRARLPEGARVGTVDKFQGQEAPIVFFSMTASSGEDVSRGLSFLFSRNRLNVAVSRAQALAVVICSPKLMSARCSTVDDMRLVNMLCQFAEAAG